jgi:dienelactone hydrolase
MAKAPRSRSMTGLLMRCFGATRLFIGALCCLLGGVAFAADDPIQWSSPADVWRGYDPTAEPLEIESLQRWQEQGCAFEKLRFTAEEVDGFKVRVFAIVGRPAGDSPRAGILHIHGGGQTASLEWVKFWTARGYACVTFDFCGAWEKRTEFTDWGPLKHGNMAHAVGGFQMTPTPRSSSWYHWTLVARRALTLLEQQPLVDRERLGIFGISVGGTVCWSVAGSDARVKAAVPIYGCGYNVDNDREQWGFGRMTPEIALFQRVLSPEAHAPSIRCAVLHLNASNDFHGWLNRSYDILALTPGKHWLAVTPHQNHHIAAAQGRNLPLWMDAQLNGGPAFPDSPKLELGLHGDGIPQAVVTVGGADVRSVEVFYTLSDKPAPNRFWRGVSAAAAGSAFRAELPVLDPAQTIAVFANVQYGSGPCLTSNLVSLALTKLGDARATLQAGEPLDPKIVAESWFYARGYTDPNLTATFVTIAHTAEHPYVVSQNPDLFGEQVSLDLSSHAIGDPQFSPPEGAALVLECAGQVGDGGLQITVTEHEWTPLAKTYQAMVKPEELAAAVAAATPGDSARLVLPLNGFQSKDSQQKPQAWRVLDKINLQGTTTKAKPFQIHGLRWELPNPASQ